MANPSGVKGRKLVVLCCHGFLQSGKFFRERLGSMRKALKSRATFHFVDAPFKVSGEVAIAAVGASGGTCGLRSGGRTWWQLEQESGEGEGHEDRFDSAYRVLKEAVAEHKPDVLIGFSQGASTISLFLTRAAAREPEIIASVSSAVFVGGFLPSNPSWAAEVASKGPPPIRSLHVYGLTDDRVPPARAKALQAHFLAHKSSTYEHEGAHMVPTTSGRFRDVLREWFDTVVLETGTDPDSQ
jgi:dihydrofolate reductase